MMDETTEKTTTNLEFLSPSVREQNKSQLEQLVLRCIVMRFTEKESLSYIKANYKNIESTRYYEIKKEITDKILDEGYKITSKKWSL